MAIRIDLIKSDKSWKATKYINNLKLKKISSEVMRHFPNFDQTKNVEIAIVLTNNEQMQQLNKEFLGKDKPTNVLSFPEVEFDYKSILEFRPPSEYIKLGDIALGYQIIEDEAKAQCKEFEHHFTHLLIHGLLHLLGFDHMTKEETEAMQVIEIDVLKKLSINTPY